MIEGIRRCLEEKKGANVVGAGISVPGRVDRQGTVINFSGYPEWKNVHLKELLMAESNLPVFVENDSNALTLALKWNEATKDCENLVFLNVGEGAGVGILINSELLYGSGNNGCEFGHVAIMVDGGPLCSCGNRGCLEAFVKDKAILQRINQLPEFLSQPVDTIQQAIELCPSSEAVAKIFSETVRYIAIGVEHIVKLFDPELIVLRNQWMEKLPHFFAEMKTLLYERCGVVHLTKIIPDTFKIDEIAAASVFLERCYSGETSGFYL